MKFVLDKSKWLRGELAELSSSLLRTEDGLMCCVGQLAEQCGLPLISLHGLGKLSDVYEVTPVLPPPEPLAWLVDMPDGETPRVESSSDAEHVYAINDDAWTTDEEKIAALRPIFAAHGIELEVKETP